MYEQITKILDKKFKKIDDIFYSKVRGGEGKGGMEVEGAHTHTPTIFKEDVQPVVVNKVNTHTHTHNHTPTQSYAPTHIPCTRTHTHTHTHPHTHIPTYPPHTHVHAYAHSALRRFIGCTSAASASRRKINTHLHKLQITDF